jgi:prevent-host-death family protein
MMTLSLADTRQQFSRLVEAASLTHERIDVTRNGKRAAVLLGADDFDSLMETLDILSDAQAVQELGEAARQLREGDYVSLDDVAAAMHGAGRL